MVTNANLPHKFWEHEEEKQTQPKVHYLKTIFHLHTDLCIYSYSAQKGMYRTKQYINHSKQATKFKKQYKHNMDHY